MHGKLNWYLAEVYTKNPEDGTSGWDIQFVWVNAPDKQTARKRVSEETPLFDVIISLDEQSNVLPLSGCTALVLSH